jgi:hypothetical protein
MKRFSAFVILSAFALFSAFTQDASLSLSTNATASRFASSDFSLSEKATPSFVLPFGTSSEIAGNGFVKVAFSASGAGAPVSFGLDQLRYEFVAKKPVEGIKSFVFDAGRFSLSDPAAYVLTSPADGCSFAFNYPSFSVAFRSAYTGLLFLNSSQILMSAADKARSSAAKSLTGSPRFIAQADIAAPRLFGQNVAFSVITQNDLNSGSDIIAEGSTTFMPGKGGKLNTQYFELDSTGSIQKASYGAFFVWGSGSTLSWIADTVSTGSYQYKPIASFLLGGNVSYPLALPAPFSASTAGGRLIVASGDKDASSATEGNTTDVYKAFTPMNASALATVFSPSLSNLVYGELTFSTYFPVSSVVLNGNAKLATFFRPTSGPVSEAGVAPGSTAAYLGSELDFTVSGRIASDVALSFIGGIFVPGDAFAAANRAVQYSAGITATISM